MSSHLPWHGFHWGELSTKEAISRSIDLSAEKIFHLSLKLYCQVKKANRTSVHVDCTYKNG